MKRLSNLGPAQMNPTQRMPFILRKRDHVAGHADDGDHVVNFQERVQQFQSQLKEMEREKERELNALRKERRDLTHTVRDG